MNLPTLGKALANAFALSALPLWWTLDPSRVLGVPLSGRAAWEARVADVWDDFAAQVAVRTPDERFSCVEVGLLADGTPFEPLGDLCEGLASAVPALRQCGLGGLDGIRFALLVRSDAAQNRAVVRTGSPERDACAERALGGLPLADRAPPGGALLASGSVELVDLEAGPLPSRDAVDAEIALRWDRAVAQTRDPATRSIQCEATGVGGSLCGLVDEAAPALRACPPSATQAFGFVVLARAGQEKVQALALSGDPARDACLERVLQDLTLALPPGGWALAWGTEHLVDGPERMKGYTLSPGPEPPMAYASHLKEVTLRWARGLAISVVVDDPLVDRVHELVACPSVRVGTRLDVSWNRGTLTVETDPPVPCVEAHVQERADELLDVLARAVDPTDPTLADRVAEAGPPRGWPVFRLDLWIVLPEETP